MKRIVILLSSFIFLMSAHAQTPAKPVKSTTNNCKYPSPIPTDIINTVHHCYDLYLAANFKKCILEYDTLITKYPEYCVAYYNRGFAKYYNGDKAGARTDLEKALTLGLLDTKELIDKLYNQ